MRLATRLPARLAPLGLGAVLLLLTGFAFWGAISTHRTATAVSHSIATSGAFEEARYAVGAEESLERKYRLEPSPEVRLRWEAAADSLEAALVRARTGAGSDARDRAVVDATLATHRRYRQAIVRMFAAVDAKQPRRVLAIDASQVDPRFALIETRVNSEASAHDAEAASRLAALSHNQQRVVVGTPIAFSLGLVLLGLFFAILVAYRRRDEAATRADLERLERAALTDSLTGLRNHRAFHEDIVRAIGRSVHEGSSLSLVMLDVNELKAVNDAAGHQSGDRQLMTVAQHLRAAPRGAAYRVGGDEFAVILTDENAWGALRYTQRVQRQLELDETGRGVTVAAGVAVLEPSTDKDALIRHADLALIEAKRSERSVLIYMPDFEPQLDRQRENGHQEHLRTLATALARAVDAKDSGTRSHCETVSELSAQIGAALGLDDELIAKLRLAGLLHDVGKIGIPDAILQKPSPLTAAEFEVMKTHPHLGYRIVSGTDLEEEAVWILHHHERPDGRGYPDGLHAAEIPLQSRILLVADAFEAITADRVYRRGRSEPEALAEIERHSGTQFDPACVAALKRALRATASATALTTTDHEAPLHPVG